MWDWILSFATDPRIAPLWAFAGAGFWKFLDWLSVWRKDKSEAKRADTVALHEHVNEATKTLINSMMEQVARQGEVMLALQKELREAHALLDDKIERVLQLEAEVIILRRQLAKLEETRGSGRRRRSENGVGDEA